MARKASNGAGSVGKEKNPKLHKPWYAKVSDNGVRKNLGHFATEIEARQAITEWQKQKADDEEKNNADVYEMPFIRLYQEMVEQYLNKDKEPSDSRKMGFHSTEIHLTSDIKKSKLKSLNYKSWEIFFDDLKRQGLGYSTRKRIRTDIILTYKYAQKMDYEGVNYPKLYELGPSPKKGEPLTFSDGQIQKLWSLRNIGNNEAQFAVDTLLMLIYSGVRISELLNLKIEDVFISDRYFFVRKSKTDAGTRKVPIHKCMIDIYQKYYDSSNTYFLTCPSTKKKYTYANYRDSYFDRLRDELNWSTDLTPHNGRKTCSSLLKRYDADPTYQKLILGHEGALSLTEKVYTKVDVSKLVETIDLIPEPMKLS